MWLASDQDLGLLGRHLRNHLMKLVKNKDVDDSQVVVLITKYQLDLLGMLGAISAATSFGAWAEFCAEFEILVRDIWKFGKIQAQSRAVASNTVQRLLDVGLLTPDSKHAACCPAVLDGCQLFYSDKSATPVVAFLVSITGGELHSRGWGWGQAVRRYHTACRCYHRRSD